ncbi:MAG: hypothetical protein A2Y76_01610 [Planctomycetes bacterium RBG_13_60_9]|nr:MAG: hypothetical protein A2Y76_01610 [Planctomycetes bacterium RBG_13_60_9]
MAFWDIEKAIASGVPVELHAFHARDTSDGDWYYADAPMDITYDGDLYLCRYRVQGDAIEQGSNALKNQTTVKADWDAPYVAQYMIAAPEQAIDYTRYKAHGADLVTNFIGTVVAVKFKQSDRQGKRHAEIIIDPVTNDLRESGLVMRSGRQCQVAIYSTECTLLRATYRVPGTVATVDGVTVTSDVFTGYPVGWFSGGDFIVSSGTVGTARRKIVYHVTNTIKLTRPVHGLAAAADFDAYPGCDHTRTVCDGKYNNLLNYRGQPLLPDGDPWSDSAI